MIFSISVIDLVGRCARMSLRRWRVGTPAVRGRHRHFHPPELIPALEGKGSWSIPAFMIPRERWSYPWRMGKSWIIWGYRWSFLVGLIWWELHVCILNWCVVLIVSLIINLYSLYRVGVWGERDETPLRLHFAFQGTFATRFIVRHAYHPIQLPRCWEDPWSEFLSLVFVWNVSLWSAYILKILFVDSHTTGAMSL